MILPLIIDVFHRCFHTSDDTCTSGRISSRFKPVTFSRRCGITFHQPGKPVVEVRCPDDIERFEHVRTVAIRLGSRTEKNQFGRVCTFYFDTMMMNRPITDTVDLQVGAFIVLDVNSLSGLCPVTVCCPVTEVNIRRRSRMVHLELGELFIAR